MISSEVNTVRRAPVIYGLLFIASYLSFVIYMKPGVNFYGGLAGGVKDVVPVLRQAAGLSAQEPAADVTGRAEQTAAVRKSVKDVSGASQSDELPPLQPVTLNIDYSSPQNAFAALDTLVQSDERPEYRLAAVGALRALMANSDQGGQIKETLRIAATDGDPRVAAAASEAYKEALSISMSR